VKINKQHIILTSIVFLISMVSKAQCSMCTKTASQLGEKPALGLNNGILYLMLAPFAIIGVIAYRWWKSQGDSQ
jgi:anaerobic C4-dicarboxylate transporter